MNLRGGWALVRKSLLRYTSNRGFFWTLALLWMTGPLVYLFVWLTAAGETGVGSFARGDLAFYYICLIVINQFTYSVSNWALGDAIRWGWFSGWLLRPLPAIYEAIATDIATKVVCMPFALGVAVILSLALHPAITLSLGSVASFVGGLLLAQALRFVLGYVLALVTLWTNRSDALLRLSDTFLFLLAGQVAPTALLPGVLQRIADVLPYRYMIGFPIELLMGRLTPAEMQAGFGWQAGWLLVLMLLCQILWRRGLRAYSAVGG